ncbi:MAG: hypothetical protein RIT28_1688 [Pseudomonadota bacterium]
MTHRPQSTFQAAGDAKETVRSLDNFRDWLRHEIAKSSDVPFHEIDFAMSMREMGMSSIHLVRLTGELEKLLGLELESTMLTEFGSVNSLCDRLFRMRDGRQERAADLDEALPVRIAASFTAEPIEQSIQHLLSRLGWDIKVHFAGYNQIYQSLLNPAGAFAGARGVNVVLLRLEDLFRHEKEPPSADKLEHAVRELGRAMRAMSERGGPPCVLVLAPHSPAAIRELGLAEKVGALDETLLALAESCPGFFTLDLRQVYQDYPIMRIWDEARDRLGHIPFTQGCYSAMGAAISRKIAAVLSEPAKVIVLDCDNTLWGGVVGELGPEGVELSEPFLELQRFMVAQRAQGKLLCLASKNNEEDVWEVFQRHPEMPLRREHITLARIDWSPKSANIRAMAEELGLGTDSFIFVDDSPMEVAEVSEALPDVLAIELPRPVRIARFLAHHWAFDAARVTAEDRERAERMTQNLERREVQRSTGDIQEFLARLELEVDIAPLDLETELARAAQLTSRTNQFNANKRVFGEQELAALAREPGRRIWRVTVRDRFGDYGFVGLISGVPAEDALRCDLFLMSCRVLGRRVEQAMLERVAQDALDARRPKVVLELLETRRNVPVRDFYRSLGAPLTELGEGRSQITLATEEAAAHIEASTRTVLVAEPEGAPTQAPTSTRAAARQGFEEIATIGPNVDALLTAIATTSRTHRPDLATPYVTPREAMEKKLANIWREVLGIDRVGIYDNFYELGGDSVRAAEAFARMWDLGVPESISLQTILEPTIAVLAKAIADVEAGRTPDLLEDRFSLAEEVRLDEDIRRPGYDPTTFNRPMETVLLTGSTGYIGAYLILELMAQTQAKVLCLVRASTAEEARLRVVANLRRYRIWDPSWEDRLDVVLGDLTADRLGLSQEAFQSLADRIDSIFHSAAWVNFVYPYQHLKATNVDSTQTILRLAAASVEPIQVHYVSTLGVIMSTGYGRERVVHDHEPLTHCDDLLNGYEQTKYVSDMMMHLAMTERGIPCAMYRPGMVSGLTDGTYHKLDEFLPQFLKGCIQLGSWPLVDTTWEIAPVDYVCKAIVHIAKRPQNLNHAYFVVHPRSRMVSEYIDWHRNFGYEVRGLPWDVWKRELLGLGTERLRKNALFPFVDFIRALSEEQVYFPPTGRARFEAATADLDVEVPDALVLLERYTRFFIECDYYEKLPSGPRSKRPNEAPLLPSVPGDPAQRLDERLRFDGVELHFAEAYYVLFNVPEQGLSFVVRYVLHNGVLEEDRRAEIWCMFRDRSKQGVDLALRTRFPIGRALLHNTPEVRMSIGPSGYGDDRVWGSLTAPEGTLEWDLALDKREAIAVNRIPAADAYDLYPHFQSNGCRHHLSGTITINGTRYEIPRTLASDGHYWNTKHLRSWAWAHCASFEGDPDFLFEGIGPRYNDWSQTSMWLTFVYKGQRIESNIIDAFHYNQELDSGTSSWGFVAERGNLRFVGHVSARAEDMILLIHPLPDDEYLYTHISYEADMTIDIERKVGLRWWKTEQRVARGTASFEVTRKVRNPEVRREFRVVRVK